MSRDAVENGEGNTKCPTKETSSEPICGAFSFFFLLAHAAKIVCESQLERHYPDDRTSGKQTGARRLAKKESEKHSKGGKFKRGYL